MFEGSQSCLVSEEMNITSNSLKEMSTCKSNDVHKKENAYECTLCKASMCSTDTISLLDCFKNNDLIDEMNFPEIVM